MDNKGLKGNNKGFTLIELVIAIGLLAIIITPVLQSFITSATVNKNSRKLMIATDVEQSIMEGFVDKTYGEVCSSVQALSSAQTISGNEILSGLNEGAFNDGTNFNDSVSTNYTNLNNTIVLTSLSANKIEVKLPGGNVTTAGAQLTDKTVVHDDDTTSVVERQCYEAIRDAFAKDAFACFTAGSDPQIGYWQDPDKIYTFIAYGNIQYNGYVFDATVLFIPALELSEESKYYTYKIFINVYDVTKASSDNFVHDTVNVDPIATMTTGIKNLY